VATARGNRNGRASPSTVVASGRSYLLMHHAADVSLDLGG
jgi:hypothetical protein